MDKSSFLKQFKVGGFFHFTDRRNIPSIRATGGLLSWERLRGRGVAPPAPGGNDWSHYADAYRGLDKYVHLCLKNTHPMEYIARRDGRIESSVFLHIDPAVLLEDGVLFTPDVSNKAGVPLLEFEKAIRVIDFSVIYEYHDWSNADVRERLKLAKKCELLVPDMIPLSMIQGV